MHIQINYLLISVQSLLGAQIRIGNYSDFKANPIVAYVTLNMGDQALSKAYQGRYLTIMMESKFAELQLCEVEVYENWQIRPFRQSPLSSAGSEIFKNE